MSKRCPYRAEKPELTCNASVTLLAVDLVVPAHLYGEKANERDLKEWIWLHHKDSLLDDLIVTCKKQRTKETKDKEVSANTLGDLDRQTLEKLEDHTSQGCNESQLERSKFPTSKRLKLLNAIVMVNQKVFHSETRQGVFSFLLDAILDLMESEFGFIGEVMYDANGEKFVQAQSITNIAWDQADRQFYEDNIKAGLRFCNLKSLFGAVLTTEKPVIANNPKADPRACGIPDGHPPLNHFLGIPFFKPYGEMIGMVGISNRPGGYSHQDIEFLEPVTVMCANLIGLYLQIEQNLHLINALEDSVKERTLELEVANSSLQNSNKRIIQNSAQQLEHFACMAMRSAPR